MALFFNPQELPAFNKPVLTIGSFDGVHLGHKAILKRVVSRARAVGGESVLLTFEPHPRKMLHPDRTLGLLTSPEDKFKQVLAAGIDHIVVVPFTRDFSLMSAESYIVHFLYEKFRPHTLVIGYDHRFGHSREGDIRLMHQLIGDKVQLEEIPAQLIDHAAVSSTKIRRALTEGRMEDASEMLGRPFAFTGIVIHGKKLGKTLGYPTANLQQVCPDVMLPGIGIYVAEVSLGGGDYGGMLSIGYNPTVSLERDVQIEVHLFEFDRSIYGETVEVRPLKFLREELRFDSLEALTDQIRQDEAESRAYLERDKTG